MQDIEIIAPDGTTVVFPAGTPDDVIERAMAAEFGGPDEVSYYDQPGLSETNPIDLRTTSPEEQASLTQGMWVRGADGTVYPLPADAYRDQMQPGDQPLEGGLVQRPQGVNGVSDAAQSLGSGLIQGVTGLAELPGQIRNLGVSGITAASNFLNDGPDVNAQMAQDVLQRIQPLPRTGQIGSVLEGQFGALYEPQTTAGEYARTIGEFAPGAIVPGGIGTKLASALIPAVASETAGQVFEGKPEEGPARVLAALLSGGAIGVRQALQGGPASVIRSSTRGVTDQQLAEALQLRNSAQGMGVPLTQAEALQQVTGGATGLGRVQRVVEGTSSRLAPVMAERPAQVRQAVDNLTNQIGPRVDPAEATRLGQETAEGVLNRMRQRVNENARPFYDRLPGQSLPPEQYAQLAENPSYARALESVRNDPEIAPLLNAELPMDEAARMLRARQQGFTQPGFHETTGDAVQGIAERGFDVSRPRSANGDPEMPIGVFTKSTGRSIGVGGDNEAQIPVLMRPGNRQQFQDRSDLSRFLRSDPAYDDLRVNLDDIDFRFGQITDDLDRASDAAPRNSEEYARILAEEDAALNAWKAEFQGVAEQARQRATQMFRARGVNSVEVERDAGGWGRTTDSTVVLDPANVRPRLDAFAAPTPDNDLNVVNRVIQQLDQMQNAATPSLVNPTGNSTIAGVRGDARGLANQLASEASPDFATARQTVATGLEAFVDPLKRGPLGVMANQAELRPTLPNQTAALFPAVPAEGQADQTLQALSLMNEINPAAGPALTRQFLATQANEILQKTRAGSNQFGGADLAAKLMGNPEQERALLGAIDQAEPFNDARRLAQVLRATGQREPAGSQTAFNAQLQNEIAGGNAVQEGTRAIMNLTAIPGRIASVVDNAMTRMNADKLAEFLLADPETARRAILQAQLNRSGSNRTRSAIALTQGED